MTEVGRALS